MFKKYDTARKHADRIEHAFDLFPVDVVRQFGPVAGYYIASYAPDARTMPTVLTSKREVDRHIAKWNTIVAARVTRAGTV